MVPVVAASQPCRSRAIHPARDVAERGVEAADDVVEAPSVRFSPSLPSALFHE